MSPNPWLTLVALGLGFIMTLLDQSTVAVALPAIAEYWDVPYGTAAWVSSAYLLALVVPLMVTGRLGDRFGHRRLFIGGIVVFTAFAVVSALAPTLWLLIAARFIQGLGAAMMMPQTMAVINQVFPRERRGAAFGVWGVLGAIAGMAGPVLAGVLVDGVGWQGIFLLHLPIGVVALVLAAQWVPELPVRAVPIDVRSVLLSFLGVSMIVVAVQEGLGSWPLVLLAVAGAAVLVRFFLRQRSRDALVPLKLFRNRNYVVSMLTIIGMGAIASSQFIPLMAWLQDDRGLSAEQAGYVALPMAVLGLVMGPVCGFLADKVHPRYMQFVGFGLLAAFLGGLAAAVLSGSALWVVVACVAGLGFGQSFIWASNASAAFSDVDSADVGAASGAYNTARQLGGVFGVAIVSSVLAGTGPSAGIMVLAGVAVLGFVFSAGFRPDGSSTKR